MNHYPLWNAYILFVILFTTFTLTAHEFLECFNPAQLLIRGSPLLLGPGAQLISVRWSSTFQYRSVSARKKESCSAGKTSFPDLCLYVFLCVFHSAERNVIPVISSDLMSHMAEESYVKA
jgi:hypothetical protein